MADEEIWKEIPGIVGYKVSSLGRIWSLKTKRELNPSPSAGYMRVQLGKKLHRVHQLVAKAFLPNPENKETVDHINRQKDDNRLKNLRWATRQEQAQNRRPKRASSRTGGRAVWKYSPDGKQRLERFETLYAAGISMGKDDGFKNIWNAIHRNIRAFGFRWRYEDKEDLPGERWAKLDPQIVKEVEGYEISTYGRTRNRHGQVNDPYHGECGYMWTSICPNRYRVHVLVAKTFLPLPEDSSLIVNHKDGNKANPHIDNLEWCSLSENSRHAVDMGFHRGVRAVGLLDLDGNIIKRFRSIREAADSAEGSSANKIQKIVSGNVKSNKSYIYL